MIPPRFLYPTIAVLSSILIWLGSRNRPDPVWEMADQIVHAPCPMVEGAADSLGALYEEVHGHPHRGGDTGAYNLVAKPYIRTLSLDRFSVFCRQLVRDRMLVVAGVTGTGTTKIAEKAVRFVASPPVDSCLLVVQCAPEFDVEMHKKYIGQEDVKTGRFSPGVLLQFWDRCRRHPNQRFVCLVDNFDKINPETFFGPGIWELLSSAKEKPKLGGRVIDVPKNFYMVSVTHLGPGSRVEFNEEHFKRLGKQVESTPNACELLDYMQQQAKELAVAARTDTSAARRMTQLVSTANRRRVVFYFLKTNQLFRERYGPGYELGQGSNIRKYFLPEQIQDLKLTCISHINAMGVRQPVTMRDFEALDATVAANGLEPGSNFFARLIQMLRDTGYLVEITMVAATALLTALIGWLLLRRRERLIRNYGQMANDIFLDFEAQRRTGQDAAQRLEAIKNEVNDLVIRRRLNYTEGLYFMAFVEDKMRRIEFSRNVSENFLELFNAFMDDNILTENEYNKLRQFLQSIWHKIPDETYQDFLERVERAYANSGGGQA
jgi:hypothetical protein